MHPMQVKLKGTYEIKIQHSLYQPISHNWHHAVNEGRWVRFLMLTFIIFIYLLTHYMEQSPSWEANRFSVKKFPACYGTRWFITTFTSAHHLSQSSVSSIQSMAPHPTSWRYFLILTSHLRLSLPSGLFPSGVHTSNLYTPILSPIRATCPAHLILLDMITRKILGEEYRSLSSSLCSFLHSHVTSSLLGPNIFLNTLFSNTLSLCSSLSVSDQVSHPYLHYNNS